MDLNEQANEAIHADFNVQNVESEIFRLLKLAWLDGYKAGMAATKALAEAAITKALS